MRIILQATHSKHCVKTLFTLATGMFLGALLVGHTVAATNHVDAVPTWQAIYVDGQQVSMTAYNINGNNYVKLRDIGEKVGFNVYWQDGVRIDTSTNYTGEPPAVAQSSTSSSSSTDLETVRQEMIQLINQVRRENGVEELPVNEALMTAAQNCSEQGFRKHDMQYEGTAVLASGYPYGFSSNLTCFSGTSKLQNIAETAVTNWVNSSGHFQTMIDSSADCLGVGVAVKNNMAYCYMMVGDASSHNPYE